MLYAQAMIHAEKHNLEEKKVLEARKVAEELSDFKILETYQDYTNFRKNNPGLQVILKLKMEG